VFAFGEGVALPTRLRFKELERRHIPHSQAVDRANMDSMRGVDVGFLVSVVERWRGATMSGRTKSGGEASEVDDIEALAGNEFSRLRQAATGAEPGYAAPLKPASTTPEAFFFPVEDPKPRLRR
jgi:hypothetical protein